MNHFTGYGDGVLDGVNGMASLLDLSHQLSNLLSRSGTFNIKGVGYALARWSDIRETQFPPGVVTHPYIHLRIVDLNIQF